VLADADICNLTLGAHRMPRKHGLRDDDLLGRLADVETRLDMLEGQPKDRRTAVPERDERRDTEARNRQTMVAEGDREPLPADPDDKAGEAEHDNVRIVDADDRARGERRVRAKADEQAADESKRKKE
jgi:hypothetical protein